MIDKLILTTLEFDKVLSIISEYAVSLRGKGRILSLTPSDNYSDALTMISETSEADRLLYADAVVTDFSFDDTSESLVKADKGVVLSMAELLRIARFLRLSRINRELIDNVNDPEIKILKGYAFALYTDMSLENDIYKSIISDSEMADNASHELKEIRAAMDKCNERIRNKLNQYTSSSTYTKYLQDNIVTIRNDRYVLPVKSESRDQIPGLIHDRSSTLATMFIEPFAIVEMNNELANLKISEQHEIEIILTRFTNRVAGGYEQLVVNLEMLTKLDAIFAKAQYAHSFHAEKPLLTVDGGIKIVKGRHPLLARDKVVPITIELNNKSRIFLVSGSNTGGKTVSMKLVGLSSLMAMSGIFPLAEFGSSFRYFDKIFCDIGDHQSIEMSLSTFSSHVSNLVNITDNLNDNSLILLDELGAGTDPQEGVALALAVTKFILNTNAFAMITTHFRQIKELANKFDGIACGSMDFDPITYAPTYKLIMGVAGSSNALKIAQMLGLRKEILDSAESELPDEKIQLDKAIESYELKRRECDLKLEDIDSKQLEIDRLLRESEVDRRFIMDTREKLAVKMKYEANKLLKDYLEDAEDIIFEIKEILNRPTEEGLFKARTLKSKLSNLEYVEEDNKNILQFSNDGAIVVGDNVYIDNLKTIANVIKIDERKNEATVKINNLVSIVKLNLCKKIISNPQAKEDKPQLARIPHEFTNVAVPMEIKLMGMDVETATLELDKYLDSAVGARYKEVRVVHGKGTGALRRAVQSLLRCDKRVDTYRLGNYGEGDSGVTIAKLKE